MEAFRASGGPMMPDRFYQVHQDEVIWSGSMGGQVWNQAQQQQGMQPQQVTFNIYAQEVGGVIRSRGEVEYQMLNAIQNAQRRK